MKLLIALAVVVACARADVSHIIDSRNAPIVKALFELNPDGKYLSTYETGNGIISQEQGVVKNPNSNEPSYEVKGSVKYTSPEGTPVEISYIADENGYQPQGNVIPVAPPIPELIQRSLEYIAAHPPAVEPAYQAQPQKNRPFSRF